MNLLTTNMIPLEREYEGWVMREIEMYFNRLGIMNFTFGISPHIEKDWPADEALVFSNNGEYKLIGFQFKRPKLTSGLKDLYKGLKWSVSDKNQFDYIKKNKDMVYALPTFTNRNFRYSSLDHCIFWKPKRTQVPTDHFYKKSKSTSKNGYVNADGLRWGEFVERMFDCSLGVKFKSSINVKEKILIWSKTNLDAQSDGMYGLIVELKK